MKLPLILINLFIMNSLFGQEIIGETWYINTIIGINLSDTKSFTLNKINSEDENHYILGNTITFNKDNTFSCNYSAPCGNDCFPSSMGTFKTIDKNHIRLFLKEFKQSGYCKNIEIKHNLDLGVYILKTTDDKTELKLVREKR